MESEVLLVARVFGPSESICPILTPSVLNRKIWKMLGAQQAAQPANAVTDSDQIVGQSKIDGLNREINQLKAEADTKTKEVSIPLHFDNTLSRPTAVVAWHGVVPHLLPPA